MRLWGGLSQVLKTIAADLKRQGIQFALVGGMAVTVRGAPRLTRDVDLAVLVENSEEAERIIRVLLSLGYAVDSLLERKPSGELATARLISPKRGATSIVVDLIFSACGVECEIIGGATNEKILPGVTLPVARATHLIAMKLLSADQNNRPRDIEDILNLLSIVDPSELIETRQILRLISARGFSRGRPLLANLNGMIKRHRRQGHYSGLQKSRAK